MKGRGLRGEPLERLLLELIEISPKTAEGLKNRIRRTEPPGRHVGLRRVREHLKRLEDKGRAHWFAEWYGPNAGYCRLWTTGPKR